MIPPVQFPDQITSRVNHHDHPAVFSSVPLPGETSPIPSGALARQGVPDARDNREEPALG